MPPTTPVTPPRARMDRKDLLLVASGAALILVIIGYAGYRYWHGGDGHTVVGNGSTIVLASDGFPASAARIVQDTKTVPLKVDGQGTATVYDEKHTDTYAYYLIGATPKQTNLYRRSLENPKAGLEQLTNSVTPKASLSVDSVSGVVAYVVPATGGGTHVVAWEPGTRAERDLGAGNRPVVLHGGAYVLFRNGNLLSSASVISGESHKLLALTSADSSFAVSPHLNRLAVHNSGASGIQYFSVESMLVAALGEFKPFTGQVGELFFAGDTLMVANGESDSIVVRTLEDTQSTTITAPGISLKGLTLSTFATR